MRRIMAAALAALLSGCLALPYASPPIRLKGGGGRYIEVDDATEERSGLVFDLSAAIHPAQLLEAPLERRFDYGAGWRFQLPEHGRTRNGAFLEGAFFFPLNDDKSVRAYARVTADLLFRGAQAGGGGTVGGGIELVGDTATPVEGADEDGAYIGYAFGEGGVGLEVAGGAYGYSDGPEFTVTAALTFRLPASAGVVLVWLWELAGDDDAETD